MPLALLSLVFALSGTPSFSAEIRSCACTSADPHANQRCGPKPFKIVEGKNTECQPALDQNASWMAQFIDQIKKFFVNDLSGIFKNASDSSSMKDKRELLGYFNCYRDNPDRFCHFRTTILPYLELSSSSARLPIAVQSCLFKRESQFDAKAFSSVSAVGYIQFMPGTFRDLNQGIINISVPDMMQSLKENKDKLENDRNLTETDKNYLITRIQVQLAKLKAKAVWDSYWANTDGVPKRVDEKSATCPSVAFAMAATKQIYDLYLMKNFDVANHPNEMASVNGMNSLDSAILLAGGYNCGVGEIAKACKDASNLEECMQVFKNKSGNNETYGHMNSIKNCAEKNIWDPMSGSQKHDCEPYQCKDL